VNIHLMRVRGGVALSLASSDLGYELLPVGDVPVQMVLTLEREGFIKRQPRSPRSIELLVDPKHCQSDFDSRFNCHNLCSGANC
jgi:hypothetical protein